MNEPSITPLATFIFSPKKMEEDLKFAKVCDII